ncbi:MAG: DUF456 family protein [Calditrichaeota bacterium]|nr:DUF456 family protein [Calditrichota bacterium]
MDVLIIIGIILVTIVIALVTWIGVPGTFIMSVFVLVCGWITGFAAVTATHVLTIFAISIALEVAEFFMAGVAARYYGASRRSAVFAILGGLAGTIIGVSIIVPIGALVGLFAGSYLGAYLGEKLSGKTDTGAARAALGAVLGNVVSKTLKSTAVVIIGVWLAGALT